LLIAVQVIGSYFVREIEENLLDTFKESINDRVELLNYNLEQAFNRERPDDDDEPSLQEEVQNIINDIDTDTFTSLQVVDSQSRVIGTNDYYAQEIRSEEHTSELQSR